MQQTWTHGTELRVRTPDRRRASALPGGPLAKYRSVGCGTILGMPATRVEASRIVTIGSLIAAGVAALCYLVYSVRAVEPVDFLVYRYAAQAFAAGSNIYEGNLTGPLIVDEGMPFTYTPPFAVIFLWPTVLFDWWTAICCGRDCASRRWCGRLRGSLPLASPSGRSSWRHWSWPCR